MAITGVGSTTVPAAATGNNTADSDIVMKKYSYKDGAGHETVYHLKDCLQLSMESYSIPSGSDTYETLKNKIHQQSLLHAGFSENQMFYESYAVMKDFYDGKIGRDEVKSNFKEYFYHSAGMMNAEWATRSLARLYEYFSRANTRAACDHNNREGRQLLESNGFSSSGSYYNADWYWKCEEMQDLFREVANELADERDAEHVDFEYVEKNTRFTLDGGITYNGVWDSVRLQQSASGTAHFLDTDMVPPKGFVYCSTGVPVSSQAENMEAVKQAILEIRRENKQTKFIFLAAMSHNVSGRQSLLYNKKNYTFSNNAEEKNLHRDRTGGRMEFLWMSE